MRGGVPCLLRESTYTAGYLGTAPLVTSMLMTHPQLADKPGTALMLGGMLSGVAAAVVSQPLDTVKTRMQANVGDPSGAYVTMTSGLRTMWYVHQIRNVMCAARALDSDAHLRVHEEPCGP
jgi:hypothetical protein